MLQVSLYPALDDILKLAPICVYEYMRMDGKLGRKHCLFSAMFALCSLILF